MTTFKYFSYGSNMLVERLQARCASARLLGVAEARGYELSFSKKGKDGSGKAMPGLKPRATEPIYGIVFEVSTDELKSLDRAEGEGFGYDRINDFSIYMGDAAAKREVTTYIANADYIDPGLQPFDWYLALVIAGACQHKLPAQYIERLRSIPCIPDKSMKTRSEALRIIQQAGFADFDELLKRQDRA